MSSSTDPYAILEIDPSVSDAELRAAYRRAVQRHHPDHNGGSPESEKRFEEVQEAYATVRAERSSAYGGSGARARSGARSSARPGARGSAPPGAGAGASSTDPRLDARLAAMEAELAAARDAQARVRQAARDAVRDVRDAARGAVRDAGQGSTQRPSDEELGYISTDDSVSSILDDTLGGLSERISSARRRADAANRSGAVTDKVADVFEDIAGRLRGEPRDRRKE